MLFLFLLPFGFLLLLALLFTFSRGRLTDRPEGGRPEEASRAEPPGGGRWPPLGVARRADPPARVFRLARKNRGRLTVSDVVIELGLSVLEAEELLEGMCDGRRVRPEPRPNGLVVYEFPEILARLEGR